MTAKYVLVSALLLGAACAPPNRPCKTSMSSPAHGRGYELEWTARAPHRALDALCGYPPLDDSLIRFEVAVLRGTGSNHVGAALRRELEPRLLERFELDGWSLSCGNSFTITLNAQRSGCQLSEVVDVVGEYLRQRHADDRIVILMGLWAAPAL